jgi:hypothetical protein
MNPNDAAFKNLVHVFVNGILARKPPAATAEERIFLNYLRKCDDEGLFEQTNETSGI